MESKTRIEFTQEEFNAFAFAVKSRLAIIEVNALAFHGETPATYRQHLEADEEYTALISLCRKFHID